MPPPDSLQEQTVVRYTTPWVTTGMYLSYATPWVTDTWLRPNRVIEGTLF